MAEIYPVIEDLKKHIKQAIPTGMKYSIYEKAELFILQIISKDGKTVQEDAIWKIGYHGYLHQDVEKESRETTINELKKQVDKIFDEIKEENGEEVNYILKIKKTPYDNPVTSPEEFQKLNLREYFPKCNMGLYYVILSKYKLKYIPELTKKIQEMNNANELMGYRQSIWKRYQYLLFLTKQIEEVTKKYSGNDSVFICSCFAYNFIVLLYSILDSLGWMINYWYRFGFKEDLPSRFGVSLLETKGNYNKQFFSKLAIGYPKLHSYISDNVNQEWISYLKEFRDVIQHRRPVELFPANVEGVSFVAIEIEPGVVNSKFKGDKYKDLKKKYGRDSDEINDFCSTHLEKITEIIVTVFKHLLSM